MRQCKTRLHVQLPIFVFHFLSHLAKVAEQKKKSKFLQEYFLEADIFMFVSTLKCSFSALWSLENSKRSVIGTATFHRKGQDELSPSVA